MKHAKNYHSLNLIHTLTVLRTVLLTATYTLITLHKFPESSDFDFVLQHQLHRQQRQAGRLKMKRRHETELKI